MKRDEKCKGCQCYSCAFDYGFAVGSVFGSCLCKHCYDEGTICKDCKDHSAFISDDAPDCEWYIKEDQYEN